jgi:tripartite ATP-independent transporter DctP family solute receptor
MYTSRRNYWLLVLFAMTIVISTSCRNPGESVSPRQQWRFAIEESEGSVQHAYALKFKELIEARTEGRVEVVVYPYGTLGTSTQIAEQLNMGIVQFAMASPGTLGKVIPELQVFLLHFVFSEDDEVNREVLTDPQLLSTFDALYAEKGLKLLSIYGEGEMVWTTRKEIRRPKDFGGIKMRVMTSPILLAAYDAYGASATPLPYSEVYSALQLNMIDGQVNPVFAIEEQKFYEVSDWLIFPKHATFITTAAANRPFFDGLAPKDQRLVEDVIAELDQHIHEVQRGFQTERLKIILAEKKRKRSTLHICGDLSRFLETLTPQERRTLIDENEYLSVTPALTEAERAAFRERSEAVQQVFLRIGGEQGAHVLHEIQKAVARAEAKRDGLPPRYPSETQHAQP